MPGNILPAELGVPGRERQLDFLHAQFEPRLCEVLAPIGVSLPADRAKNAQGSLQPRLTSFRRGRTAGPERVKGVE